VQHPSADAAFTSDPVQVGAPIAVADNVLHLTEDEAALDAVHDDAADRRNNLIMLALEAVAELAERPLRRDHLDRGLGLLRVVERW
jgi:hypothetical protein